MPLFQSSPVKRPTRAFLILFVLLCLAIAGLWMWTRPVPPPKFSVGARRIVPAVTPSFAIGQHFAALVAPDGSLWALGDEPFFCLEGVTRVFISNR